MSWSARTWHELKSGTPGRRFASVYEERHRLPGRRAARALVIAAGMALVVLGTLMILTPGPGALFAVLGASLVASESRGFAHALDWCELRLRAMLGRLGK
jgi:hypothetical protein